LISTFTFGRFEMNPASRELRAEGIPLAVGARAFDLLQALIERRERLVGKNELLDLVWPGLVVDENNLQVQISALRKLLGPDVIATVPGRGYRFTARLAGAPDGLAAEAKPAATPTTPVDAPASPSSNLPRDLPQLYGRDADVASLDALLAGHKLVTVVGAGGIGKSRLAQAVARAVTSRWPEGAWMVELAGLSEPALVPNAVARTLDIPLPGQRTALDELVAGMAQRRVLLVLDNCEHLLDATSELVQRVLHDAPSVTVLATSQEPLRLPGEQQYRVAPLAVPARLEVDDAREFGAIALLEARVRAADPRFVLNDDNMALAIEICRRLDGLPLAIELAAARVATLGLRPVHDKLDARFRLLTGGSRATLRRHQTLRAALEWSHNLLNDAEKAVFRRLGAFAGGFTMQTAQAVAADAQLDEWAVLDHLSALVEKSLVVADAADPPRYWLLESARAFALEQLAERETAQTLERHARAMRSFIERVDTDNLDGELRTHQYAALVLPELDNLRAAHAWAAADGGDLKLATAIAAHSGSLIDYAIECIDWVLSARCCVEQGAVGPAVAARYWRAIAASNMSSHVPKALQIEAAGRARAMYEALGQPRRVFSCLIQLAQHRAAMNDRAAAQQTADEARRLLRPDWPAESRIVLLRIDSRLAQMGGRLAEAVDLYREGVRISEATGDWRLEVIARIGLVDILWRTGPIEDAATEARRLCDALRARPATHADMSVAFANVLGVLSEMGRIDEATAAATETLLHMRQSRDLYIDEWAYFFWRKGRVDVAAQLLGASDAEQARAGVPRQFNEQRLTAETRAGLEAALTPDALANHLAQGAALDKGQLFALIADALA
jgi:predicted ATPase/DNA-binding winged helix-turn-helix (wHTH) protein